MIKVLNLYAGIGGNRKLWQNVEVTNIEYNPKIAKILKDYFPKDKIIVTDAHEYLLKHYKEYDFIWSSPPCPSHSRIRYMKSKLGIYETIFPDLKLYEEIIFLKHFFKGKYVVENVISYYDPLIKPQQCSRHYFWCNFKISNIKTESQQINKIKKYDKIYGFDISKYELDKNYNHTKVLRNMVDPMIALHIFNMAFKEKQTTLNLN